MVITRQPMFSSPWVPGFWPLDELVGKDVLCMQSEVSHSGPARVRWESATRCASDRKLQAGR